MNHERFIQLDPGTGRSPVPVNYVRNLVELIAEVGVDSRRLLSQVGLSEDEVYNPEPALRFEQFRRVMVGAREITGDPALGLALGQTRWLGARSSSCKSLWTIAAGVGCAPKRPGWIETERR